MSNRITKKVTIFFITVAVVLLACSIGVYIYNMPENRLSRQLEAANQCLEERDYEQAVAMFAETIEMDPESVEAYLGMAEAYKGMEDARMVVQTWEKGYEATGDERFLDEKQNYDNVIEWEEMAFETLIRQ